MEWRIIIRRKGLIYRAFKLIQNANNDITIIPHQSIHIDRDFLSTASIGDKIVISTEKNEAVIDHFSAHSRTGQRHIKFNAKDKATEPILGSSFKEMASTIPLVSVVASTAREADGEPKKGKWYGFEIPDDTDHCIFDLFAIPKDSGFQFNFNHSIQNDKQSVETFNNIIVPMRNLSVVIVVRTSNHNICTIPYNVTVQQANGKTAQVVRVSDKEVQLEVSNLSSGKL